MKLNAIDIARRLLWLALAFIAAPACASVAGAQPATGLHLKLSSALPEAPSAPQSSRARPAVEVVATGQQQDPRPVLHDYVRGLVGFLVYALYGAFAVSLAGTPRRTRTQLFERIVVLVVLAGAGSLLSVQFLETMASASAAIGLLIGFLVFFAAGAAYGYRRVAHERAISRAVRSETA